MFDYSVKFEAIDKISAKINAINDKMASMGAKASQASTAIKNGINTASASTAKLTENIKKTNAQLDAMGSKGKDLALKGRDALLGAGVIVAPLMKAVTAYQDIAKAQGEIASTGISASGVEAITKSAMNFSSKWAGIGTADFIKASYDIKGGIESLSDADVAKFTEISALTAKATKSMVGDMTNLFALGYGIFRKEFKSDMDFANQFGAGIASAVKIFKTEGTDLSRGLQTLGSSATALGVSFTEQMAIIGVSKETYGSASEAATGYRAFLRGVVKAQDDLGLSFVDSQGKLLPMAQILDKIKNKTKSLGLTMENAKVQDALTKAFGSDEATKMIANLIDKTDKLRNGQKTLQDSMKNGSKTAEDMAIAMQRGMEFDLLKQKIENTSAILAKSFAPTLIEISKRVGGLVDKIKTWTEANPKLTETIAKWAMIIGGILATIGVLSVVIGVVGMAIGSLTTILTTFMFVMKAVRLVTLLFNIALWANPITWVVGAIVALIGAIALLIIYWKDITQWVSVLWEKFTGFISSLNLVENALFGIKSVFEILTAPIQFVIGLLDTFLSKFELYNIAKEKAFNVAGSIIDATKGAYNATMASMGINDTSTQNTTPIDNTNKNHTVVDVRVMATGATITDQKATTTNGRVKLNTGSTGV